MCRTKASLLSTTLPRDETTRDPRNVHIIPSHKSRMHKYRNALFIIVSLLDVLYGGMGERDCERYPCPLGGAAGFGKIWGAERCEGVRRVTGPTRGSMRAGGQRRDRMVPNAERAGDIRVSHPRRTTTRRIGNTVKDIKSSATIRQSFFRYPSSTLVSRPRS